MAQIKDIELEELEEDGDGGTQKEKMIQLTENYRLKYDKYKNKWIEKHIQNVNKNENSKRFGEVSDYWEKIAGFMPTYELLCDDFVVKKTARAEAKKVKDILQTFADGEKEVRQIAKELGRNIDTLIKAQYGE